MSLSCFTELCAQYIDGAWRPGNGSWDLIDINPYTGGQLAAITVATAAEVDDAYRAAERAQGPWAKRPPEERRQVFEQFIGLLERYEREITEAIVAELGGTPVKAEFELTLTKEVLRQAMTLCARIGREELPAPPPGRENRLYRIPVGVVGVVSSYNFPLFLAMKSVAPALALGNGVVLKPHHSSPVVGGTLLARLFTDAGLPGGLLNVVITDIAEIGDALIEHPVPRVLSYTGSDTVGRHVATVAARHFKRCVLEMSGNSALIVLDDADVEYAVDAAVFSRFAHQGQVCMAANRVLVDRSLEPEFTARFIAKVRGLRTGDPADPATHLGPLINARRADRIREQIDEAIAEGATPLVRGTVDGALVEPTVLTDVAPGSPVLQRELYGPVALIMPFDGEDEAVKIANDTPFGLSGAVHTADVDRGVRVAQRIETGMIHVNDGTIHDEACVPFGGEKNSGMGRLNGEATVEAFTTVKWISIQHGRTRFPF